LEAVNICFDHYLKGETMETNRKFEFEKKFTDKGLFTPWFNVRYWLLRKLGLNGYSLLAFPLGVTVTLIALQLFS
jgi:hypothetical protein